MECIKMKNYDLKDTIKEVKKQSPGWEKYLKIRGDLYLVYINS